MSKLKRVLLALAAALSLTGGVVAVTATPSFASWHDTGCPVYHLGRLCIYNGYNGGGDRFYYPDATVTYNVCYTLPSAWQGVLESIDYDMVDYLVRFYNDLDCNSADLTNYVNTPGRYDYDQFSPNILLTKSIMFKILSP